MAAKLKKGDTVVVLTGKDKGKTGEITQVMPKDNKAVVDGVRGVHPELERIFDEVYKARPLSPSAAKNPGLATASGLPYAVDSVIFSRCYPCLPNSPCMNVC